jgi:hypothetical protein
VALALLAHGGNVATDVAEDSGSMPTAKAARDFVADLGHAQVRSPLKAWFWVEGDTFASCTKCIRKATISGMPNSAGWRRASGQRASWVWGKMLHPLVLGHCEIQDMLWPVIQFGAAQATEANNPVNAQYIIVRTACYIANIQYSLNSKNQLLGRERS